MNDHKIKDQWKQRSGRRKSHWSQLTDDDLKVAKGDVEYTASPLQELHVISKDGPREHMEAFDAKQPEARTTSPRPLPNRR